MMNDWGFRQLGEVCRQITDGSHNPPKGVEFSDYPMLSSKNIGFDNYDYTEPRYLTKDEFEIEDKRTGIEDGDVLITIVGTIGRACCIRAPFQRFTLQRSVAVLKPRRDIIFPRYLMYSLLGKTRYFEKEAKGVAQKGIYLKQLAKVPISVPPIQEQERIVTELDLLSGILDSQKAQVNELGTLANSVFFDMFGNPVENERGWNSDLLGTLTTLYNGRAFKPTDWSDSGLPIVRIQNLNNPQAVFNYYSGFVEDTYLLHGGELLYAWSGTPGTSFGAHVWYGNDAVLNQHIFKVLFDETRLTKVYFLYYLNMSVQSLFDKTHGGVGLQHITKGTLMAQVVPLPPLSLQRLFAAKIDSIEQQKKLINQSITETQKLLDFKMDKYFG